MTVKPGQQGTAGVEEVPEDIKVVVDLTA